MAWTTPKTFAEGDGLTAEELNVYLRDNFNETAPAKARRAGGFFVVSDTNQIEERRIHQDLENSTVDTTSTSYIDLDPVGPTVTLDTGATAIIILSAHFYNTTAGATTLMSHDVTGDSTLVASDNFALLGEPAGAGQNMSGTYWVLRDNLTPGTNTFTAKYRVTTGTGTWLRRRILVLPL